MAAAPKEPPIVEVVSLAVALHRSGHLVEAEELYQKALERAPGHVDANHFLGVLRHQQGKSKEAVQLIRLALYENPRYLGARINLGNVLKESGRFEEAETEYRKVIEANPKGADAHNNLGTVLRSQNEKDEAIASFERAIELDPRHADAFQNLGNMLKSLDRLEDSLTAYRKAVEIDPEHTEAHLSLGRALYSFDRLDEAIVVYRQWLKADPDNPIAQHMLAACQGDETPDRCSEEFVKQSFDAFANSFDEVLGRLDYCAPALIEEAIKDVLPTPVRQLDVLDAGCGTGLCGEFLRPYASHLVGIDLSPNMVHKARIRDEYDELHECELANFIASNPDRFDLIVSADTLIYFGKLAVAFSAVANALRTGGVLAFTLERADRETAPLGYRLYPNGRFSHREDFVRESLIDAGLTVREIKCDVLRSELHQPVDGLVVTAIKES